MADTGISIGAFAEGLMRGSEFAQDSRRRAEINAALKRERGREQAIDDTRFNIQQAADQGVDRALEGPTQDGSELRTDPAQYLQSLRTQARLTGDENSIKEAIDMSVRTGISKLQMAKQTGDPQQKLALVNQAAAMVGLGNNAVSVNPDGSWNLPGAGAVPANRLDVGLDIMLRATQSPELIGQLTRDEFRTEDAATSQNAARDAAVEQADARLDLLSAQLGDRRDAVNKDFKLQYERLELANRLGDSQIKLEDARTKAYLADVAFTNTRAKRLGVEGIDPAEAIKYYKERQDLMLMRQHPMYETDPQLKEAVGSLADTILRGTKLASSPEQAIDTAEALIHEQNNPGEGIKTFDYNKDTGEGRLNGKPLPPELAYMVGSYLGYFDPPKINPSVTVGGVPQRQGIPTGDQPTGFNDPMLIPKTIRHLYTLIPNRVNDIATENTMGARAIQGVIDFFVDYDWEEAGKVITGKK
jgi:hypothetical protein